MLSNVAVSFVKSSEASGDADASDADTNPFTNITLERVEYQGALSELFETKVILAAHEDDVDPKTVVGKFVEVDLQDQAFIPHVRGIVRRLRQLTSEPTGLSRYELTVVPALWLMTQRTNSRIFQNQTVEDILGVIGKETLGAAFHPPTFDLVDGMPAAREYRVQYDETDYKFVSRILAEEGLSWFFDVQGKWTITDDTTSKSKLIQVSSARPSMAALSLNGEAMPFRPPSAHATEPHVANVATSVSMTPTSVVLRDYDYTRPPLDKESLDPRQSTFEEIDELSNDDGLETYRFEVGKLKDDDVAQKRAQHEMEAERAMAETYRCETTFFVTPGFVFKMADHPRAELNHDLMVVRSTLSLHDANELHVVLECVLKSNPWRPPYVPKPRIFGTQTGFVVTASTDEEISVDERGRVRVYFPWDRRNKAVKETTRAVRVSQGWAGAGYGFMMIPRRMHEVIVAYINGDPDEPIIVGRVHNEIEPPPLKLPDEKTKSIWLSRSSPAPSSGSAGFNRIMMEDKAGSELLDMYAQKDYTRHTNHNETISVDGSQSTSVGGSESHSNHDYSLSAKTTIKENAGTTFDIHANGGFLKMTASTFVELHALGGDLFADASANMVTAAKGGRYFSTASSDWVATAGAAAFLTANGGNIQLNATAGMLLGNASSRAQLTAPTVMATATDLCQLVGGSLLIAQASTSYLQGTTVNVVSTGTTNVAGPTTNVSGNSAVNITGGPVTITGAPIRLNC